MKKLKIIIASFAFIYIATSFIKLTIDFRLWNDSDRFGTILLGVALSFITMLFENELIKSK